MDDLHIISEDRDVLITVKVVPGSSRTAIAGVLGGMLKVKVAAPPEKGKANRMLASLLAQRLGVGVLLVAVPLVMAAGFLWLALAPEGTRSRAVGWRSGFYRVAVGAGVPLLLAQLDFARRSVGVRECLRLSGDAAADMAAIARAYADVRGRRPALASPVRLT